MTKNRQMVKMAMIAAVLLAYPVTAVTPAHAGSLLATGQTTPYQANKNDGIGVPVDVPDDGTLQRGVTLRYQLRGDGTVEDRRTGLIWEVKCSACGGGLHDVANTYRWSGDGTEETIWDWLDDINAEGGAGYAGHNNWRIPNRRELESLVDAELFDPSIDPIFGPTAASDYWSSTTFAGNPSFAWNVFFDFGSVFAFGKSGAFHVRAVRGGS